MGTVLIEQLSNSYKYSVLKTRKSLLLDIHKKSPTLSIAAENILKEKLSNSNGNLWGELYPWVIKEIFNINSKTAAKIAKGWLAIYLHTIYIDSCIDSPKKVIKSDEILASSILAKEGLLNLQKIVSGTRFEKLFDDSLNISAKYELADYLNSKNINSLVQKEKIAIEKNRIILACTGAFAAVNNDISDYIISFTKSLLLSIQYLDDITDLQDDFQEQNYSYLISSSFSKKGNISMNLSEDELLKQIISSNALMRTIEKINMSLNQTIEILQSKVPEMIKNTNAFAYFVCLQKTVIDLLQYLKLNGGDVFERANEIRQTEICRLVKEKIYICNVTT